MSMPDVYSKAYSTEDELWQRWNRQGDQYMALGGLIARLKELAARAGQLEPFPPGEVTGRPGRVNPFPWCLPGAAEPHGAPDTGRQSG